MKSLVFVTGNPYKFEVAKKALEPTGIEITQEKLETPEIQSTDVSEVASFSAKWAADKLGKPVVVSDSGYYIEALNGFPGPFIRYANEWLGVGDILRLMEGKSNRKVEIRICLAYCEPKHEPVTFQTIAHGSIPEKEGEITEGHMIDRLFIPEGYDKPSSDIPHEEMVKYWMSKEDYWKKLAKYLAER